MIGVMIAKRALAKSFEAMGRKDLDEFMSAWRDDGVFIYPGEIPESGTFHGKDAIEGWFRNFFDKFEKIHFDVQDICVKNIFDMTGTNVITVHWNASFTNLDGRKSQNSGVSVITIEGGKAVRTKDFLFNLGEDFRKGWGAA